MKIKNTNILSNNPTIIKNNIVPVINSSNNKKVKKNKKQNIEKGISKNLSTKIENLKSLCLGLSLMPLKKKVVINNIKDNKLVKSDKNKLLEQEKKNLLNLYKTILNYSNFCKDTKLTIKNNDLTYLASYLKSKLNTSETKLTNINNLKTVSEPSFLGKSNLEFATEPKMEKSGLFLSLVPYSDYLIVLNNALNKIDKNKKKFQTDLSLNEQNLDYEGADNDKLFSYKIRHYLNLLTNFKFNLATSYYDFYQFKKNNKYLFKMEKATEFLNFAFLSKGCLISKPIFNLTYPIINSYDNEIENYFSNSNIRITKRPKIIINLFFYVKNYELFDENKFYNENINDTSNINLIPNGTSTEIASGTELSEDIDTIFNNFSENNSDGTGSRYIDLDLKMAHEKLNLNKDILILTKYGDKFIYLCDYLTKLFNAEIELEITRLYKPYQDSNILVQYLNNQSYDRKFIKLVYRLLKRMKIFRKKSFWNKPSDNKINSSNVFNNSLLNEEINYPSGISGINIKLAGRPINERIIPRFTVKRAQRGNFDRVNTKMIEKSMFTDKTKKGAFNFTVRLSHIFR